MVCQIPEAREFKVGEKWPLELGQLFEESVKAYAGGAYTASAMVSRKLLMACACQEGASEKETFASYVSYIVNTVLTLPRAKDPIDKIRSIGNDANHKVCFVSKADAKQALSIVNYLLNTIYSLPLS